MFFETVSSILASSLKLRPLLRRITPPLSLSTTRTQTKLVPTCSSFSKSFVHRHRREFSVRTPQGQSEEGNQDMTPEEMEVLRALEKEEEDYRKRGREGRLENFGSRSKDDEDDDDIKLQDSISQRFVPFRDQQRIIQDVIDEIWNPLPQPTEEERQVYEPPPEFLQRGIAGVFDLPELINLLKEENCDEIVVISIPREIDYADQMVIVTCKSLRHLLSSATYVRKRFKMKNLKRRDVIPVAVKDHGQGWIALDLGNIILHLFLQRQRDHFDLEVLWTVGPLYDDLYNSQDPEIIQLLNLLK